jgi:hypothetical protein
MTYAAVFDAFMDGLPITRKAWLDEDENRIVYYDPKTNSFVDRHTAELWETQCNFPCFTYTDMDADDWEVCEWETNNEVQPGT